MALQAIKQEIKIDGAWTAVTSDTRGLGRDVRITRGSSAEQANIASDVASFYLDNLDGRYSNRNPLSPYYRLLGLYTPYRCSITQAGTSLRLTDTNTPGTRDYDGARAWTADKASLDITGDIDIRIDAEADDWYGRLGHVLAGKYVISVDQRAWAFCTDQHGYLMLIWSTNGAVSGRIVQRSTATIAGRGRQAFRATLDVNNGAGQYALTFYTSTSINGTWTQLGSTITGTTGTTSIFASNAPLEVGTTGNAGGRGIFATSFNADPFTGRIYSFELRNGIAGTVVARMDATAQASGTTSWSDGLASPNTWALAASAEITDADYRFHGEIPEFPSEWDTTGTDVVVNISASSVAERLMSGQKPLRSPIYRNLTRYAMDGYWPMESDLGATTIGAYVGKTGYMKSAAFGTAPDLPGSAGALGFTDDDGYASGVAVTTGAVSAQSFALFYFKFDAIPAANREIFSIYYRGGTVYKATFNVSTTNYSMELFDRNGTSLFFSNASFGAGAEPNQWIAMRLLMDQNVNFEWGWYAVGAPVLYGMTGSFAGTSGRASSWISWPFTGKSDLQIAHVALSREDLEFTGADFTMSTNGYVGENARDRAMRLAAELGIPFWWIGPDSIDGEDQTPTMGAQGLLFPMDLFQECADIDGGILHAPRDKLGLAIRSYYSLLNRSGPTLDYAAHVFSGSLRPRENRDIRNDVTITRADGSFGRWVKEEGPNNVNPREDDPDGVGLFDVSIPRNASEDRQLIPLAQREVLLGTWDELRFSVATLELHRSEVTVDDAAWLDLGRPFILSNLPVYAGGPTVTTEIVRGYTEMISNITRTIDFNLTPYGPYLTGVYGLSARRYGAKYTTLKTGVNSTATPLTFSSSDVREHWSTTAEPYSVLIAGELITVTSMGSVSGSGPYDQTATVTRSVNGIVKSLDAGEPIQIFLPARWGMRARP